MQIKNSCISRYILAFRVNVNYKLFVNFVIREFKYFKDNQIKYGGNRLWKLDIFDKQYSIIGKTKWLY